VVPNDVEPAYATYRRLTGVLPLSTQGDEVQQYQDLGQGWTSLGTRGDWP